VGVNKLGEHLTEDRRQQSNKLRAHGRQLDDSWQANAEQSIEHLVQETTYEQWHRMLFVRFLAENHLLIYEAGVTQLDF
jgi:phage-related protein